MQLPGGAAGVARLHALIGEQLGEGADEVSGRIDADMSMRGSEADRGQELQARGWLGSERTVCRYLRPFRQLPAAPPAPAVPKARQITSWLLSRPATLDVGDQAQPAAVLARCPRVPGYCPGPGQQLLVRRSRARRGIRWGVHPPVPFLLVRD